MRLKVLELKKVVDVLCATYNVDADSVLDIDLQNDNPGEGKISDILTINVNAKDGSSGLMLEVYGAAENRPPRSVYTKILANKKPD